MEHPDARGEVFARGRHQRLAWLAEQRSHARAPDPAEHFAIAGERQERIARFVDERGCTRVTELVERFCVSAVTIRKDLISLQARSRLMRIHGGAMPRDTDRPERSFDLRQRSERAEKHAIGIAAAAMVRDGQTIALDASTTALHVAHLLRARPWRDLTVVTNGLRIAAELAPSRGITVVLPAGMVRGESFSVVGGLLNGADHPRHIDEAFVGAAGFTIEGGLTEATFDEARLKRAMVDAAGRIVAMVDHTKWGRHAAAPFAPTSAIDTLLTDAGAPPDQVAMLQRLGAEVRLVYPAADGPDLDQGLRH